MRVLGYTYEFDVHCIQCAVSRFGVEGVDAEDTTDKYGDSIGVIFSSSEWHSCTDADEAGILACGDCGGVIDECSACAERNEAGKCPTYPYSHTSWRTIIS